MPYQNLSTETIIAIVICFIVMFLFVVVFIAGLGSILSEHKTKIASRLKTRFNAKFFPGSET